MYEYKVDGDYFTNSKNGGTSFYETSFILNEKSLPIARSIIQNTLLHTKLRKELDDYRKWRTADVQEGVEVKNGKPDVSVETEQLAKKVMEAGKTPHNINSYEKEVDKQKVLKKALNRKSEVKKQNDVIDQGYID